ncbi:MAG: hypothetical protein RR358_05870, partial [Cetobacterium sp.]
VMQVLYTIVNRGVYFGRKNIIFSQLGIARPKPKIRAFLFEITKINFPKDRRSGYEVNVSSILL